MLGHWTCHSGIDCFRTEMMWHWSRSFEASPSASFVMTNIDCFRTWMMGPWTWSFEASPSASLVTANYHCFRTWMMVRWTCRHFEAGQSAQLHS